ncbi:MAG: acetolactate synthase [Solirubrobacterales bacterium]|nr:acetolactate synthase [Solirubrobacterales bacterium]
MLRRLDFPYISLNPGASYRGLHDSLVNLLGNERPEMVVCLHEEHAVAVAHGYAKVTEQPLAVALHSNVGLMHGSMALFNAFCDRVPMLVLGATGPVDAAERRPWIDWIHTSADQGALVRDFVKWDDQPASPAAAVESVVRGHLLTTAYPSAPVYVCLDAAMQEAPMDEPPRLPDLDRHQPPAAPTPGPAEVAAAIELMGRAQRPLLLIGRVGRGEAEWDQRIALAQRLGALVLTDLKVAAGFPTAHPLHPADPGTFLTPAGRALVRDADLVVSLDWVDLAGTLRQAYGDDPVAARVIHCSCDLTLHRGWSKDHFALPPVDLAIGAHPDRLVDALLSAGPPAASAGWDGRVPEVAAAEHPGGDVIAMGDLAASLRRALEGRSACLVRLPLGWQGADLDVGHPLDYLGQDGGAGLASGPGMAVGAALALRDDERLPVAVLGDGDLLMGSSALWTAAHHRLPLLVVVANNRSFYNDEVHQERVALRRGRPVENRWIGQHIRDPDPDLATLARSMGLQGHGPIDDPGDLDRVLSEAVQAASAGATVLVDVRVTPHGYPGGPGAERARSGAG